MPDCGIIFFNFNFPQLQNGIIDLISSAFSLKVSIIQEKLDCESYYNAQRNQYYSTKILESILINHSDKFDKLIVITDYDLFVPVLTFVFGEAQLKGVAAIVSTHRLRQEFYGLPVNDKIFSERLNKEILHELGHTYGLRHCRNWDCVMHASSNIDEIDVKGESFCKVCTEEANL